MLINSWKCLHSLILYYYNIVVYENRHTIKVHNRYIAEQIQLLLEHTIYNLEMLINM